GPEQPEDDPAHLRRAEHRLARIHRLRAREPHGSGKGFDRGNRARQDQGGKGDPRKRAGRDQKDAARAGALDSIRRGAGLCPAPPEPRDEAWAAERRRTPGAAVSEPPSVPSWIGRRGKTRPLRGRLESAPPTVRRS